MPLQAQLVELQQHLLRLAQTGRHPLACWPDISLTLSTEPTLPYPHLCEPTFSLVAQGAQRFALGDTILHCHSGQFQLVPLHVPVDVQITQASQQQPFLGLSLRLHTEKLTALLLEAPPTVPANLSGLSVSVLNAELMDAVIRLLRLTDKPADLAVLAAGIEREIYWRLLNSEQGKLLQQIARHDSAAANIQRAVRWLRENISQLLRVEDLAASVNMSISSFHRHFRAATAMTPVQYQKKLRLQNARLQLLTGNQAVAAIAFSVGYDSASQFNRDYKREFGNTPGKDRATQQPDALTTL